MRTTALLSAAAALLLSAASAHADVNLVTNGNFEDTTLAAGTKGKFNSTSAYQVTGWSNSNTNALTFIDTPGTADNGTYLSVYSGFPKTDTLQTSGGNFVEADGDPTYSSTLYQLISGLTIGTQYAVTFDFAGGEQAGFTSTSGYTTEYWNVGLDTVVNSTNRQKSATLTTANGSFSGWTSAYLTFTATATSEYLSFLAGGTPTGAPPIAFLDNVALTAVPEPLTLSLMGVGLLGTVVASRRRRAGGNATAA